MNKVCIALIFFFGLGGLIFSDTELTPQDSFDLVSAGYAATSYLTEGQIEYRPANLGVYEITDKPWSNDGGRYGVDEVIRISSNYDFNKLLFSNGYVSFGRPDLFLKNSRVRAVRILDGEGTVIKEAVFEDTSELQVLLFDHEYWEPFPYLGPQGMDVMGS